MNVSQLPLVARALRRHRLIVAIVALQVIVTVAVVTNIAFLFVQRLGVLSYHTGLDESGLAIIEGEFVGDALGRVASVVQADLQALRELPGVATVAAVSSLPLGQSGWTIGVTNLPTDGADAAGLVDTNVSVFAVSNGGLAALGLRLESGRDFSADAYVPLRADDYFSGLYQAGEVIVSRATADLLFPGQDAVGRIMYADGRHPLQIVGVVAHLARPVLSAGGDNDVSVLLPLVPDAARVIYAVRTEPSHLQAVLAQGGGALKRVEGNRVLRRSMGYPDLRRNYFRHDMTMAALFIGAGCALLLVTGIGVYGLASFWVRQRYVQVGIRRALGARRRDVLQYFLSESLMISVFAGLLGAAAGVLLNLVVARFYEVPVLQSAYLLGGVLVVVLVGQVATFLPTWRAVKDDPVVSLRGD